MVTKEQIEEVLKNYPTLNAFGFGLFDESELTQEQYQTKLKHHQQYLFDHVDEIEHVIRVLQPITKIKTFNLGHTSYGLKHWAEGSYSNHYITNGSFIVGAILEGFKVKLVHPNALFNMSEKSLNAHWNDLPRLPR